MKISLTKQQIEDAVGGKVVIKRENPIYSRFSFVFPDFPDSIEVEVEVEVEEEAIELLWHRYKERLTHQLEATGLNPITSTTTEHRIIGWDFGTGEDCIARGQRLKDGTIIVTDVQCRKSPDVPTPPKMEEINLHETPRIGMIVTRLNILIRRENARNGHAN